MSDPCRWTTNGFIEAFRSTNEEMTDVSFAFILGAGASKDSGIPTGGELVQKWLAELRLRHDASSASLEAWATENNLDIQGFDYASAASFYPQVFDRRFEGYPAEGYAALEKTMEKKRPSVGYAVLAWILSQTPHRVVITTNFDNLVSDALLHFTDVAPLVCGHESLASYIRPRMRRPAVAKIHRDLFLDPFSGAKNTSILSEVWTTALKTIFANFSPIFIGYGGNDGSLMGFLETLQPGEIAGRMYWCYMRNSAVPPRVEALVRKHYGALVPIDGFDVLMLQLAPIFDKLEVLELDRDIRLRAEERADLYKNQLARLMSRNATGHVSTSDPMLDAMHALISPERGDAFASWAPVIEAWQDPRASRRWTRLLDAVRRFPDQTQVLTSLAWHTVVSAQKRDEAAALVDAALEQHPEDVPLLTVRGRLYRAAGNIAEAQKFFTRALAIAPNDTDLLAVYGIFLAEDLGRFDEAERIYRLLADLDPQDRSNRANWGEILTVARKWKEADDVFREIEEHHAPGTPLGVVFFHRALIAQLQKKPADDALGHLKFLCSETLPVEGWNFDSVLRLAAQEKLPSDVLALYSAIAAALVDSDQYERLEKLSLWQQVEPLPFRTI
jgi:tetratricopeptide (TPR) repeat protein